jgi:hypothetical protein
MKYLSLPYPSLLSALVIFTQGKSNHAFAESKPKQRKDNRYSYRNSPNPEKTQSGGAKIGTLQKLSPFKHSSVCYCTLRSVGAAGAVVSGGESRSRLRMAVLLASMVSVVKLLCPDLLAVMVCGVARR